MRRFGVSRADLDVDFVGAVHADAVNTLLGACLPEGGGETVSPDLIAEWTLNHRLQALIAVRLAGERGPAVINVTCPGCGAAMELDIDVADFVAAPAAGEVAWQSGDGQEVMVRLPCGRDQQQWITERTTDVSAIAGTLVTCVDGAPTPPSFLAPSSWLDGLSDALEAHDPLTTLALRAECPECALTSDHDLDLESLLMREFADAQRSLLDEVCRLAAAFHWSEGEIVALPPWRRARYLARLDAGSLA